MKIVAKYHHSALRNRGHYVIVFGPDARTAWEKTGAGNLFGNLNDPGGVRFNR
jgi:hypothetical protein